MLFPDLNLPITMYLSKVTSSRHLCWAEQIRSDSLDVHLAHCAGVVSVFRVRVLGFFCWWVFWGVVGFNYFFFLKEWGRGVENLFSFSAELGWLSP